jgi:hypothetical protein
MEAEKNGPMLHRGARTLTDDLDEAVLDYVLRWRGIGASHRHAIEKPYSTVLVRCLKLGPQGCCAAFGTAIRDSSMWRTLNDAKISGEIEISVINRKWQIKSLARSNTQNQTTRQ